MANKAVLKGFKPLNGRDAATNNYIMGTGETTQEGDILYLNSAGYATGIASTNPILGVQAAAFTTYGVVPSTYAASTTLGNTIVPVWDDPNLEFVGMQLSFSQADPYTTAAYGAAYDVAGAYGAQYIDQGASSLDTFKIMRLAAEFDTGKLSVAGAYAKVVCKINPARHFISKQVS